MKVYVVMRNDYPDAVFYTREDAEAFCIEAKEQGNAFGARIHWQILEFQLIGF